MSKSIFTDIPADEWEQTYCADELAAERKTDKKERGRVSDYALSLISLLEAGGVSRNVFQAVHIYLSKSKYHAPDESVKFFSERDAGDLLPGDPDVAYESLRKRFVRAWGEIEAEQARTGKRFCGRREKGSIQLASRKTGKQEKKKAPEYFSQIAQAVVDVQREADRLRGSREDRFRRAALMVWKNLPAFTEAEITIFSEKPRKDSASESDTPKGSRRLDRFVRAAKEMLTEAKKRDNGTVEATCRELAVELGKVFAEALDVDQESALRLLADTLTEAADAPVFSNEDSLDNTLTVQSVYGENEKVRATSQNQNPQNSEQKREDDSPHVYGPVHVEPDPTPGYCVACGDKIHPERLEFDTELCDLCGPPRQKGKPTTAAERERWGELADVLIAELKIAAARTSVSSVPAFLAEHLRRRLWKIDKKQARAEGRELPDEAASAPQSAVDASSCPDCGGLGWWYPEGEGKGVAKCKHARLGDMATPG
jgi:hypothetical protein